MTAAKPPGLELPIEITGADCRCKVENDHGRFFLPAENMADDCPLHGVEAVERMRKAAETRGPWKQTYLGVAFYPLDPKPADIRLGDIAHALALTCRFGGHCRAFYSVAQHSVHVSERLEELGRNNAQTHKELGQPADGEEEIIVAAMWGLMHDAAESYVGDLISPIKSLPALEPFRLAERVIELCITTAFGLPADPPAALKAVDVRMLYTEARDLMKPPPQPWGDEVPTYPETIVPWGPTVAEAKFLDRFHELEHKLRRHRESLER